MEPEQMHPLSESERIYQLRSCTGGYTLLNLLDSMGISADDRFALIQRIWKSLSDMKMVHVGECAVHGDVLNDDQVVTLMALLVQELIASIGTLRPMTVHLRHLTELVPATGGEPMGCACSNLVETRVRIGG